MPNDTVVEELLETILESNRSAESVFAEYPEHLDEVRNRLKKIRAVEAHVESLFPTQVNKPQLVADPLRNIKQEAPEIPGYDVQQTIGRGGMGVVYLARHLKLNRPVALKMLLTGPYASKVELLRFVREAEAVAALRHVNIIQVYDVGEVNGLPFFTMEFVEGGNLSQKLAGLPQPAKESAELVVSLARAVESAHRGGIVHRDLKPANILISEEGVPKISDFGLARRVDVDATLTMTGARLGTPNYMAPEQLMGGSKSAGPIVDVYALGAILYEMLVGRPPFHSDSISEIERRLTNEEPIPPSRGNLKVPRDLETICLKCLQKDPAHRYQTAGKLAEDLDRFLRHEPIHARPVGRAARVTRWVRRNRSLAALFACGAMLAAFIMFEAIQELALATSRRAEKARLTARLESGLQLEQQGRYAEATAILGRLGDGGYPDLRQRIDAALASIQWVDDLESVRVDRASEINGLEDSPRSRAVADKRYGELFNRIRIGAFPDDPKSVAKRVSASETSTALLAALDDWAVCTSDVEQRAWLLDVSRRANPDAALRDKVRDPSKWDDRAALQELSQSALGARASVQLLTSLADRMDDAGINTIPFRRQIQQHHADDFLANFCLANALRSSAPTESLRYYQAAIAVQPKSANAYNNAGMALVAVEKAGEAIDHLRQALTLNPSFVPGHYNLGIALISVNKADDAIQHFNEAIKVDPSFVAGYVALAEALIKEHRFSEARSVVNRCLQVLEPASTQRATVEALLKKIPESDGGKN